MVQLPTGAWFDPLDPDPLDPDRDRPFCVHGNPNVLTRDVGTSALAQGCTGHLMSGGEDTVDEFMKLVSKEDEAAVRPLLDDTDGVRYIGQASPSKLFFQAGRKDTVVPKEALETLIRAGSEPKRVSWYQAGHSLAIPKAQRDQLDWLAEVLEIEGPPVEGAETGP